MDRAELEGVIDAAWEEREEIGPGTGGAVADAVSEALELLDAGTERVAE